MESCVWVWGKTIDEDGNHIEQLSPRIIANLSTKRVLSIATGGHHCLALCEGGCVYSWGDNSHGQLGLGHSTNISAPALIRALTLRATLDKMVVEEVVTGVEHSMARTACGVVFSWGGNVTGQLGRDSCAYNIPQIVLKLAPKKILMVYFLLWG
jgi:E3 ubiquitin-protein ligase HERC4